MDMQMEDKYVQQIENSLSKQMDQDLFVTGRRVDKESRPLFTTSEKDMLIPVRNGELLKYNNEVVPSYIENDTLHESGNLSLGPMISRSEYIRQAREACLRQLSETKFHVEQNQVGVDTQIGFDVVKPSRSGRNNGLWFSDTGASHVEGDSEQDVASYRSLVIRTVCAVVIFAAIFIIDYFKIKIGGISSELVREYVGGKDYLKTLEETIMTFLK